MGVDIQQQQGNIDPQALVDALRERGENDAADIVVRVLIEARAMVDPAAADTRGVMGALDRDRARGNVSQWYSA